MRGQVAFSTHDFRRVGSFAGQLPALRRRPGLPLDAHVPLRSRRHRQGPDAQRRPPQRQGTRRDRVGVVAEAGAAAAAVDPAGAGPGPGRPSRTCAGGPHRSATNPSAPALVGSRAARRDPGARAGRIRTCDLSLRRRALYPLSYGRAGGSRQRSAVCGGTRTRVCGRSSPMDLSRLLRRHRAARCPRARRGLPGAAAAPRRRPAALRLRRGHAAPAAALASACPSVDRGLPHALPRRPLARAAGDAEVLRPARPRRAADRLRAARPARAARRSRAASTAAPATSSTLVELEPGDERRSCDGYESPAFAVRHRGPAFGYALVEDAAARALRRRAGRAARRDARARTSAACSAARPSAASRPSRSSGPARRGPRSSSPATPRRATRSRVAAHERRPARARGDVPRGRARARARRRGHSHRRARRAEVALEAEVRLLALTHLSTPLRGRRDARRGPRRLRQTRSSRATSTRSRCRSPRRASRCSSTLARLARRRTRWRSRASPAARSRITEALPLTRSREARKERR